MKKIVSLLLLLVCSVNLLQAQSSTIVRKSKKLKEFIYPSNVLKLNAPSLLFKAFAPQYEYKFDKHWSFALGIIYRPLSSMVLFKSIAEGNNSGLTLDAKYSYGTMKASRISVTPELRYYFRKTAPRGFYAAPFVRYRLDKQNFDYHYAETNTSANYKIGNADFKERSIGLGVLIGYQVVSRNHLTIDFWMLGPWFGNRKSTIKSKLNTSNLNLFDKSAIISNLEEIAGVPVRFDNSGVFNSVVGYAGGLRGIGVNFGYNF
jgi:Protein of unknown function (DUF3575)